MTYERRSWVPFGAAALVIVAGCGTETATSEPLFGQGAQWQDQGGGGLANTGAGGAGAGTGGLAAGGSGADQAPIVGDSPWCQTLSVLRDRCQSCHGAELGFGAPMPLVSYADTQAQSAFDPNVAVYQKISTRIHDANMPMPPVSQAPLTPEQKATVDAWVAMGAPPGPDPSCSALPMQEVMDPPEAMPWPDDCEERYEFRANTGGGPHVIGAGAETHPQFTFDIPWSGEVQAVSIRPITDNKRVLHHWILYQGENFLTGWSPGKTGENLPPNVGIYMPSSGSLLLDVHYYNVGNPQAEEDRSGVEICITRTLREHTATTFPFAAPANAPAGQETVNENTCTVNADTTVYLMTSSPHMHKLGVQATMEIQRTDGTTEVVHNLPFSFEDQVTVPLDPAVALHDGDRVKISCRYVNDTAQAVGFGTNSDDEMCFNFARYYPMCGMTCTGGDSFASILTASQGGGCPESNGGGGSGFPFPFP